MPDLDQPSGISVASPRFAAVRSCFKPPALPTPPPGALLRATAEVQSAIVALSDSILIPRPGDPGFDPYRPQWTADHNPGLHSLYPELAGLTCLGIPDLAAAGRFNRDLSDVSWLGARTLFGAFTARHEQYHVAQCGSLASAAPPLSIAVASTRAPRIEFHASVQAPQDFGLLQVGRSNSRGASPGLRTAFGGCDEISRLPGEGVRLPYARIDAIQARPGPVADIQASGSAPIVEEHLRRHAPATGFGGLDLHAVKDGHDTLPVVVGPSLAVALDPVPAGPSPDGALDRVLGDIDPAGAVRRRAAITGAPRFVTLGDASDHDPAFDMDMG